MAKDIFHNSTSSIPKNDPKFVRVDMETSDMGARKSFLSKIPMSNDLALDQIKSK